MASLEGQELLPLQTRQVPVDRREVVDARGTAMDLIWHKFVKAPMTIHRAQDWGNNPMGGRSYTIVGDGVHDWAVAFADPPATKGIGTALQLADAKRLAQSHFNALIGA